MISLEISILSIVAVANIILGLVIFSRGVKSLANILFGIISIASAIWCIAIIGFYSETYHLSLNWIVITHSLAILIPYCFLLFSLYFPKRLFQGKLIIIGVSSPMIIFEILIFFSNTIVGSTYVNSYQIGILYPGFSITLILFFFLGFFFSFIQSRRASNAIEKKQAEYVLIGSIIASSLAIVPNLIFPYFKIFQFTWLGPIFTLIMIVSLFMAMLKYHLFNVNVILTEVTSIVIVIALLLELLTAQSVAEVFLKMVVLIIVAIFSFLLIKSVYREILQRERIEKLAGDLQVANDRLKELDKQKSEFVSFATHQLRAPLTAMKGYASLILEGDLGKISHDIRSAISRIFDSSKTLANIVDDYLNVSRIELGQMKYSFEPIDLRELVESVIGELKPNIEKSKLNFSFVFDLDKKYMINADKDKFKQIITNLIDNSMKYTPSGSMTVSLEKKIEDGGGKIIFSVKDTGIGISGEVLSKVFSKFTRGENGSRQNIHGTGLGLYVAKEIVTAHKGQIWAESEGEGKGATFYVEVEEGN